MNWIKNIKIKYLYYKRIILNKIKKLAIYKKRIQI